MNSNTERPPFLSRQNEDRPTAGPRQQILRLCVAAALTLATPASAQSYSVIKSFTGVDGSQPYASLVLSNSTLYGTTDSGGSSNCGVVFKVNTDRSGFSVLKNFTGTDGRNPDARLLLAGTTLYGTTDYGGTSNRGVVFKVNTDGSGYAVLKSFAGGGDGKNPYRDLVLLDSMLYGATFYGGTSNCGVVFKVNTDGSGYAVLKSFTGGSDGECPAGGLALAGSTLYGTTYNGGTSAASAGVVFKLNTDGSGYMVLKSFDGGGDGGGPRGGLVLWGSTLYGTTINGGTSNRGVVFKVNTDGSGYVVLKSFTGGSDGSGPSEDLVLAGSTLYGTTINGGTSNRGAVFKVNTDGSGYAVLKSFAGGGDGGLPYGGLVLSDSTLYGTTLGGGDFNNGLVFSLSYLSIKTQPLTQTAEAGTAVDLQVKAVSLAPGLGYQWFFGGTNALASATNAFLELTNVQPAQAGAYTVVVTDLSSCVTSSPASLSVIAPVPRRTVAALTLLGQTASLLNLDSRTTLQSSASWETLDTVSLTNASQSYFDLTIPVAAQRFYRAWQTNVLSPPSVRDVHLVPAITLTDAIGSSVRVDYINQFGPIDAWVTNLATVTLTSSPQFYFDTSVIGQPARLYRLVALP